MFINNSPDISAQCKHYSHAVACYHMYKVCDKSSGTKHLSNSGAPHILTICRKDCDALQVIHVLLKNGGRVAVLLIITFSIGVLKQELQIMQILGHMNYKCKFHSTRNFFFSFYKSFFHSFSQPIFFSQSYKSYKFCGTKITDYANFTMQELQSRNF